jgi:hypothetical protein
MYVAGFSPDGSALDVTEIIDNGTARACRRSRLGTDGDIFLAGPVGSPSVLTLARFAAPFDNTTCAGDSDCDGDIDFDDIGYFVAAIGNNEAAWHNRHMVREGVEPSCSFMTNDTDFDGDVDFDDISPFVNSIGSACPSN